jgi:transposase
MHIIEGVKKKYCFAKECVWNSETKKYQNPGKCIGQREGKDGVFIPNKYLSQLFFMYSNEPASLNEFERLIVETAVKKYGEKLLEAAKIPPYQAGPATMKTAHAIFFGPRLIFGSITKRYSIQHLLEKSFPEETARDILALAWYIASEGCALSNSDSWLDYYDNPRGSAMSSQDISRLLDSIDCDGMMSFYKLWMKSLTEKKGVTDDKVLYDLTSISCHSSGINSAEWGHNRDNENLRQVNFALLCMRRTGMPIFAWPLNGSISDVSTLENTLNFLEKLEFKPDCLMMDRGFASMENITCMFRKSYRFLQALRVNADWIRRCINAGEDARATPENMVRDDRRTYYVSTNNCKWVLVRHTSGKRAGQEEIVVHICTDGRGKDKYAGAEDGEEVLGQYPCQFHALYCQDLVGGQHDRFMESLKAEHARLLADSQAEVKKELARFFVIDKPKYARARSVEYNVENIKLHRNNYCGYICFLTNDGTVQTAQDALREYSTRDCIEKDFDEVKNDLDMGRIRVHTDARMRARLFIQFIAEIYLREIRVKLKESEECRKMTRTQIFSHMKTLYKVKFKGKYRDVLPRLTKSQRCILDALGIGMGE